MRTFFQELRFAFRVLYKHRGLTVSTSLTLALGIGLTATMFSIAYGTVWRSLPFRDPDRIVHVERTFVGPPADPAVPVLDFFDCRAEQTSFENLAAFSTEPVNVGGRTGLPQRRSAAHVTANTFAVLGVQPVVGRTFSEVDDRPGAPPVAVVSHAVWRDLLGETSVLDDVTIRLDGANVPVVGVMPARWRFPFAEDVWVPLRLDPASTPRGQGPGLNVIARLKDGRTRASAQAEFDGIARRLAREYPATNQGVGLAVQPYLLRFFGDLAIRIVQGFFVASVGVLLIACTNVVNLLLASSSARMREVAVRLALGASRSRVVTQLLLEVLAQCAVGGLVGLWLARIGVRAFNDAIAGMTPPFWLDIRLDAAATLFVLALVVFVSLVAGLVPALRASGIRAADMLQDASRGATGWRIGRLNRALVVVEVALLAALLVGAGLLVRSVLNLRAIDLGFSTEGVLTGRVVLPPPGYPDAARRGAFWDQVLARLVQQPGVRSATLTSDLPGLGSRGRLSVGVEGRVYPTERDMPRARGITVGPRFFETFGLELLEGRDFGAGDSAASPPVALVNRHFADRFLPGENAVGRRLRVRAGGQERGVTIIGVAPNMRIAGVRNNDPEAIYLPHAQWAPFAVSVALRTRGDPMSLSEPLRKLVAALDPDLPVDAVDSLETAYARSTWAYGTFGTIFAMFGVSAFVLTVIGVYGLMTFSVAQRTREMGIRLAMGAQPADLLRMVLAQALWLLGLGLAVGLAIALVGSRQLMALLVDVRPRDPVVFTLVAATLLASGLAAAAGPALRAARTNPTETLRQE